jgi:carboxylesterase type B
LFASEFPAQVHDAKCAIRWLKANAGRHGTDVDRVGAIGTSSGGCLALLLGLTDKNDGLEGECGDLSQSSRVQAVVNVAGVAHTMIVVPGVSHYLEKVIDFSKDGPVWDFNSAISPERTGAPEIAEK